MARDFLQKTHRKTSDATESTGTPGKRTLTNTLTRQVQAKGDVLDGAATLDRAARGVEGSGEALPYHDTIQFAFGKHDLGAVEAHTGAHASEAAAAIGAEAYAMGSHIAFGGAPDLHTAAHEAAHVVQQRAGVQLKGGVGEAGDDYERHADAVADRVVQGGNAEALLDTMAGDDGALRPHGPLSSTVNGSVQRKPAAGVDETKIAADGKAADAPLNEGEAHKAIAANNLLWTGNYRNELIAQLRGGVAPADGESFSVADVKRVLQLQVGSAATTVDGIIRDETMALLLHAGLKFSAAAGQDTKHPDGKPKAKEVRIEFWPGELEDLAQWEVQIAEATANAAAKGTAPMRELSSPEGVGKLYIKVSNHLVAKYDARGGPPRSIKDDGGHTADPTQGSFTVGRQHKGFTTQSWDMSKIGNGTDIRRQPGGTFEMRTADGTWHPVPSGIMTDQNWKMLRPVDVVGNKLDPAPVTDADKRIKQYDLNDFGDMAYKLQRSDGKKDLGFYMHTSPMDEVRTTVAQARGTIADITLDHSHGCVHSYPQNATR